MKSINFEKPRTMVMQIYNDISRAISRCELKPGQVLREKELQEWFGVSRAPIREAVRLLEADRLVVVDSYKKKYIRQISRQDFWDISLVISCLEGFSANLATGRITGEQIDDIQQINEELKSSYIRRDSDSCVELNTQFHTAIANIADNKPLTHAIRPLLRTVVGYWLSHSYYKHHDLAQSAVDEHDKIIEAFRSKNAEKAEQVMRNHIIQTYNRLIERSRFTSDGDYLLSRNTS